MNLTHPYMNVLLYILICQKTAEFFRYNTLITNSWTKNWLNAGSSRKDDRLSLIMNALERALRNHRRFRSAYLPLGSSPPTLHWNSRLVTMRGSISGVPQNVPIYHVIIPSSMYITHRKWTCTITITTTHIENFCWKKFFITHQINICS